MSGIFGDALHVGNVRYSGLVPMVVGAAGYFQCVRDFIAAGRGTPAPWDPPTELVVVGLYRYVRNPIYVSILIILAGEAIFFEAVVLVLYGGGVFLGFHLAVVLYEEPTLLRLFGESWRQYIAAVPRWLPRFLRTS